MKCYDAVRWVDEKQHNVYSLEDKLLWLRQVEEQADQLRQRCGLKAENVIPEPETELSVPAPFDQLYLRWLEAQIDYTNQEFLKYNNAMAMFNAVWQEYANFLRRKAESIGRRKFF